MTVLRVDGSIQGPRSASSELADIVQAEAARRPAGRVGRHPAPRSRAAARRRLGHRRVRGLRPRGAAGPRRRAPPWRWRPCAGRRTASRPTPSIFALPLYNWGVSQHVKTWIDLAVAGRPAGTRLLEGIPVVLLTTRGGGYGPGTPREGWDHNTDYLRRILADVWGADLTVIERELTLAGVNPAMDGLRSSPTSSTSAPAAKPSAAGRALAERLQARARNRRLIGFAPDSAAGCCTSCSRCAHPARRQRHLEDATYTCRPGGGAGAGSGGALREAGEQPGAGGSLALVEQAVGEAVVAGGEAADHAEAAEEGGADDGRPDGRRAGPATPGGTAMTFSAWAPITGAAASTA